MVRSLLLLGIVLALRPAICPAAPDEHRSVPVGRWIIEMSNGVRAVYDVREDGTASVVELPPASAAANADEPAKLTRTSLGFARIRDGAIFIEFQDGQVERWTRNGAKMAIERWVDRRQFPDKPPTAGVSVQPAAKGLRMTLHLERKTYRVDEPVTLEVIIENTGDADAYLGMLVDDYHLFTLAVSYVGGGRGVGGIVPLTRYGADLLAAHDASKNFPIRLKAGERRLYRFALNRMVDMTISGTYSIVLVRTLPSPAKDPADRAVPAPVQVLVSDELRVEITEPPDRAR